MWLLGKQYLLFYLFSVILKILPFPFSHVKMYIHIFTPLSNSISEYEQKVFSRYDIDTLGINIHILEPMRL